MTEPVISALDVQILERMKVAGIPSDLDRIDPMKRRYRLRRLGYCVYDDRVERLWGFHYWHLTIKGIVALKEKNP